MGKSYDAIVIGGGSAGAVIAARLSEDPSCSVLLLEAGPDYPDLDTLPRDLADGTSASQDTHDWHLQGTAVEGRQVHYARGKVTGGSSAVNGIVAIRGVPEDYDEWAELGNSEWSWEKCLPYFRKIEDDRDYGGDLHGKGGPIPVVRWKDAELAPLQSAFLAACQAQGYPRSDDHNVPGSTGVGSWAMNRNGTLRISTAIGYLAPARDRLNLTIRANCQVNRVLFDGNRAIGVEVQHGGRMQTVFGEQIILSAGALHSPAVLLRSGVGPAAQLSGLEIPVVLDLPGVGENLREHPSVTLAALPVPGTIRPGDPLQQVGLRYTATGSDEFNDMQMYMWSYETDRIPQLKMAMPDVEFMFALCVSLQRPRSTGRVTLASRDLDVQPDININLLADDWDTRRMMDGVRRAWAILHEQSLADHTESVMRPAANRVDNDERLSAYLQAYVTHLVHPVGTCKMGPSDDPMAVVDQFGRVHGIEGLRVADASVMPNLPRANTNLTSIMIGERVADFIREGS